MAYSYVITKSAAKDIGKLNAAIQKRIKNKLAFYLKQSDPLSSATHLVNSHDGQYRWRVGNWRIVFDVDGQKIVILRVQHRSEVYRK